MLPFYNVNVVIFENCAPVSEMLEAMLKVYGCTKPITLTNLIEAESYLTRSAKGSIASNVDLVYMDLIPPNDHGMQFLKWLKAHPLERVSSTPVIFTTNNAAQSHIEKIQVLNPDHILLKPYTANHIANSFLKIANN